MLPPLAQNITAAEYFIDTDPGVGSGTSHFCYRTAPDINNVSASINTSGLTNGSHHLFIRTRSQEGKWSITNYATFYTDMLAVTPDTIVYGNVPTAITVGKRSYQLKTTVPQIKPSPPSVPERPFTTNASLPVTIQAGKSDTIKVSFTPAAVTGYLDSVVLTTSAGKYKTVLSGNGIAQIFSWMISPVTGYNYGNITVNNSANYTFTVYNKGNVPVTLSNVVTNNNAFVPTFTAGTIIAANGSLSLPVVFSSNNSGTVHNTT